MSGINEKASNTSSSSGHASIDEVTRDRETALTGQVAAPINPGVDPASLAKIDSRIVKVEEGDNDPLDRLPEHERQILKRQLDIPTVKVTYLTLYRYATTMDWVIIVISAICAIAAGAILPLMTIIFGQLAGTFQGLFQGTISQGQFNSDLGKFTLYFVYLGVGEFVTTYITTVGFLYTGEHISSKMRERYLQAILRQNIGFFDKLGAGEITTRITSDSNLVQDGISEKVGLTLTSLASFVAAFVIGFVVYWKLTLILTSTIVAIVVTMGGGSSFMMKYNKKSLESYALGGTVAEEVLSSIRNATAFNTQAKLARQYRVHLDEAKKWGLKFKIILGVMIGGMMGVIYLNYGLAFWMGSRLLVSGECTLSDILTILLAVIFGAFSLGHVGPWVSSFTTAISAAAKIYGTIDRVSPLDPMASAGKTFDTLEGTIELRNVKHIYPSRPEVVVMEDVSLLVPAGKTTALVGASGSGKSTIVGLVERFYDPVGGVVLLDGQNIQGLNLHWLRQQISLVQQEPVLFATSIFNNIRHGLLGPRFQHLSVEKTKEMVLDAARMANAHDFITALPEGYETNVGERGFLLSGGQKQRIAIARAIVSDPKILLLDEATSALDTKSEGVVQAALDRAAQGRTTIVIAHRLSTIKGADNIVVMQKGRIVEQGTHDDLLERRGAYFNLVEAQRIAAVNQEKDEDEVAILDERDNQLFTPRSEKGNAFESDPDDVDPASRLKRTQTGKSLSSIELEKRKPENKGGHSLFSLIKLVGSFNKKEWHLMLVGLFWSIIAGANNPVQAVFFAKCIVALSRPPSQYAELRDEVNFWSLMYLMLGLTQFIAYWGQGTAFAYCSERLVHRVRDRAFSTMLRQDIAYFDKEENNAGALTSFLSTETTKIEGISGVTLGTLLNVLTTLIAAIALGLAIGWKLALVCIATIPILLACGFFRFWMLSRFESTLR